MSRFKLLLAGTASLTFSSAAMADIVVVDAYALSSGQMARSGAAFMVLQNTGAEEDRLIDVLSSAAKMVALHTHVQSDDGVMSMREVEQGIVVPAEGRAELARGGDHVMFMGLTAPFEEGATIEATLVFEVAGEVPVELPVRSIRPEDHGTANKMDGAATGH
ncbi:MAG: copper-binding protein [Pseudooceanicola sp.]|nr:copper-binding protein [Pseudooceanicola sp.]